MSVIGLYLRTARNRGRENLVYYALDPVLGKGAELARTAWLPHVTSDWTVSPEGTEIALAVHDVANPRIRIVPLGHLRRAARTRTAGERHWEIVGCLLVAGQKGMVCGGGYGSGTLILFVNERGRIAHSV